MNVDPLNDRDEYSQSSLRSEPSHSDLEKLADRIRSLADRGRFDVASEAIQKLWSAHCYPEGDQKPFVSKEEGSLNRYRFELSEVPKKTFWEVYVSLEQYFDSV